MKDHSLGLRIASEVPYFHVNKVHIKVLDFLQNVQRALCVLLL